MDNLFLEVFPEIKLDSKVNEIASKAVVLKISKSSNSKEVRILLESKYLISHKNIEKMAKALSKSYFTDSTLVEILPKFVLSTQYNLQNLWDEYSDTVLYEIKKKSPLLYTMLSRSDISFESPNDMYVYIEEGMISQVHASRLLKALNTLLLMRCNIEGNIQIDYKASSTHEIKEEFDHEVDMIIQNYTKKHAPAVVDDDEEMLGEIKENNISKKASEKEEAKKEKEEISKDKESLSSGRSEANPAKPSQSGFQKGGSSFSSQRNNGGYTRKFIKSDKPGVLYQDSVDGPFTDLCDIRSEIEGVCVKGKIFSFEDKELKNERHMLLFDMYDGTDSISAKLMLYPEFYDQGKNMLKNGMEIAVKGSVTMDKYDNNELVLSRITGIETASIKKTTRLDTSLKKRVELHCHTRFSEMDGVSKEDDLVKTVASWGWNALAVTDHGIVQALPKVDHILRNKKDYPEKPFKLICGMEGYLVDDDFDAAVNVKDQTLADSFVVFDIETTGLSPYKHKIIEIGAVKIVNGARKDSFSTFVNPHSPIPFEVEQLTGIHENMVCDAPDITEVLPKFLEFCEGCSLVAHNAKFDVTFIHENCKRLNLPFDFTCVDTLVIARAMMKDSSKFTLDAIAHKLKIKLENHHRAVDDADCTAKIFQSFVSMLLSQKVLSLKELNEYVKNSPDSIRKMRPYHISILVKNETGRINLNRLVSESHINYYNKSPKIPRSLLIKYREGLILGSACEAGELVEAILEEKSEEVLSHIVDFYDYLEVMPIANNEFMKYSQKSMHRNIQTDEDLRDINRKIIKLGEQFNKPVCATGDSHFINPEDEIYRAIVHMNKFNKKSVKREDIEESRDDEKSINLSKIEKELEEKQPPLYLRTTSEMLEEFDYLGAPKAEEIVITNTNMIADMCDDLSPTSNEKCPPELENSEENLRNCCYETAKKIYGEKLPKEVEDRLETELKGIIDNGYAVLYMIARNLVKKSEEDGYLVGSRGSVGSSFVATMSGITEVNPLHAHYYCKKCHYSDFDSDLIKSFACMSGYDLPDKDCPVCGEKLTKSGFDIPFQTFLGFSGDKEPDIDLNFSGEYQGKAHRYTEVLFGKGHTFHAGTMSGIADKMSIAYVHDYYEAKGIHKRNCEIARIAKGVEGVRKTTGQHPGGIVVLPHGREIYEFTAIQKPANDINTDVITTHYEYHDIDKNLLKLDILGHVDPTMMKFLEDLTGTNCREIPLDDKRVMSIFQTTTELGYQPNDIEGLVLGCLGIPEFGTRNTMNVLLKTKPQTFTDLIRISGLTHGTNVWDKNAETLIDEGKADITGVISTRDDIMVYLMSMGLEGAQAFPIMEKVRKGKGLEEKDEELMREHNVPEWYIWSCKRIKYMFPKAHAAAYVTMGWRVGYYKVYYPLAYYAAYFSIRATKFSYETMCNGLSFLRQNMQFLSSLPKMSKSEEDTLDDMRLVEEFYVRGFEFVPIDLKIVKPDKFQIVDGKLMPSLKSIEGIADTAAKNIVEGCKDNVFTSQADLKKKCKIGDSVADKLVSLGIIKDLPKSDQLSIFDI
ncbi:MAG: PolC-type DNA polymerase III [Lachnospiraceae bacterium]|nr:PolC-type DNA polymerase III [Lachnospiraceae bacterium]